jgi:hypothetical protein
LEMFAPFGNTGESFVLRKGETGLDVVEATVEFMGDNRGIVMLGGWAWLVVIFGVVG